MGESNKHTHTRHSTHPNETRTRHTHAASSKPQHSPDTPHPPRDTPSQGAWLQSMLTNLREKIQREKDGGDDDAVADETTSVVVDRGGPRSVRDDKKKSLAKRDTTQAEGECDPSN